MRNGFLGEGIGRHRVLGREVLVDSFEPTLAAEARHLDPTEGNRSVGDNSRVETHHARLQALNETLRT